MTSALNRIMAEEHIADLERAAEHARIIREARRARLTARRGHLLNRVVTQRWLRELASGRPARGGAFGYQAPSVAARADEP